MIKSKIHSHSISHKWWIVIVFFWGSVLSLVAFDWSDYVNYLAQSSGAPLSPAQQAFYFALFPTLLYVVLGSLAYLFARLGGITPVHFVIAFIVLVTILPAVLTLFLPQASNFVFFLTVWGGTVVSVFIGLALDRRVKKA
ncbi:MAG: hypothetical protein M1587_09600 [Thaumarchaeota archaeon]|nr:hypothetical protein [Nitrososphaerota archaeon]